MTTGDQYARFNSKGLVNYEDWGTYFMTYTRESNRKSVLSRWNQDGVLDTALTLSDNGTNQVRVVGSSWATDGLGHILDIAAATTRNAIFQNSNTIVYFVALFYAEAPTDVRASPRTGVIQYARMAEVLGRQADPNAVVNNGNGTLTFTVDSVTESGITNAGRTVRVFKKTPGLNATTLAVAVEDCVVAFTAGANKITTAALFGQTGTPSTTAADYTVICLGPAVTRNEDLRTTSGAAFIGTVTGNGGLPTVFSTADQRLLKSQNDATQITYTPTTPSDWPNPDPTLVQGALDKVAALIVTTASDLAATTAAKGTALIGNVALPAWNDAAVIAAGTLKSQLDSIISNLAGVTGGDKVGNAALANWADTSFLAAGSVYDQLFALVTALAATTGDIKLGSPARSGTPIALSAGSIGSQLAALLVALNNASMYAYYTLNASTVATVTVYPITVSTEVGGFTLPTANEIQVPAAGTYLLEASVTVASNSTTDGVPAGFNVEMGGTNVGNATATRYGIDTTKVVRVAISMILEIATPASQRVRLSNLNGSTMTVSALSGHLVLRRIK